MGEGGVGRSNRRLRRQAAAPPGAPQGPTDLDFAGVRERQILKPGTGPADCLVRVAFDHQVEAETVALPVGDATVDCLPRRRRWVDLLAGPQRLLDVWIGPDRLDGAKVGWDEPPQVKALGV